MHSAEPALIPGAGNYPSPFTMDKAPSHRAPRGGRAGCPASDSLGLAAPEQDFPLISVRGEQTRSGEIVPNPSWAGSCDGGWQGIQENRDALDKGRKWVGVSIET